MSRMPYINGNIDDKSVVITVEIPKDAQTEGYDVVLPQTAEYITSKVKVVKIEDDDGNTYSSASYWRLNGSLKMTVGEITEDDTYGTDVDHGDYEDDYWYPDLVPGGIKYYLNKEVAKSKVFIYPSKSVTTKHIDEDGCEITVTSYPNGLFTGVLTEWWPNGHKHYESHYFNGYMDGPYKVWHTNGQLAESTYYVNGTEMGLREEWYNNGQKQVSVNIVDGDYDELCQCWHYNGLPKCITRYKNGDKDGTEYFWNTKGVLIETKEYNDGKYIGQKYWTELAERMA
jgi:antitoxin component YwqK of YwqJK toxin-antitoxin module